MLPWLAHHVAEIDQVFGGDAFPYGIEANRPTLNALVQCLHEQALIAAPVKVDDLFVPIDARGDGPAAAAEQVRTNVASWSDVIVRAGIYGPRDYLAIVEEVLRAKPTGAKGRYIKSLAVSTTMGPSVRIDPVHPKGVESIAV
jgi:hypothetical protein